MDSVNLGAYYPVYAANALASTEGTETTKTPDAVPSQVQDIAELSGKIQSGEIKSVEEVLAKLHEMGLIESASLPLEDVSLSKEDFTILLKIALAQLEETGGTAGGESVAETEEGQLYFPPALTELSQLPITMDGKILALLLATPGGGGSDGLMDLLQLGEFTLPTGTDGSVVAKFLDGTFRNVVFNQETLNQMIEQGQVTVADTTNAPSPQKAGTDEPLQATPEQSASSTQTETAQAAPEETESAPPQTAPAFRSEILRVGNYTPSALNTPEQTREWTIVKATAQSYDKVTEQWLREAQDAGVPPQPSRLQQLRQAWVTRLRTEEPAMFRAYLQMEVSDKAQSGQWKEVIVPKDFTQRDLQQWLQKDMLSYDTAPSGGRVTEWLREQLTRLLPTETETAVQQQSMIGNMMGSTLRTDDTPALLRRFADYLSQIMNGAQRQRTKGQSQRVLLWEREEQPDDYLDKAWKRRQIAVQVDTAWSENLKSWLETVDGWLTEECQSYINGQVNVWTCGLVDKQPAHFRSWLTSPVRHAASTGWFNEATGSFPIQTLPDGFSDLDYARWTQWDVLDYL